MYLITKKNCIAKTDRIEETDNSTIVEDVNKPFSIIKQSDRKQKKKSNHYVGDLNNKKPIRSNGNIHKTLPNSSRKHILVMYTWDISMRDHVKLQIKG